MGLINKDVIKRMRHNEKEEETVELNWDDPNMTWQSFVTAPVSTYWDDYTSSSASSNRFFDVKSGGKKRKRKIFCHGIHK